MRNFAKFKKLTPKERGYILGFYVGDGNIFVKKETGVYRIKFFLYKKEKNIEENIKQMLMKLGINTRIYNWKNNTRVIEMHSKDVVAYIRQRTTKNGLTMTTSSKPFLKGYIEGLIDSDGYVQRNYTEITTCNYKLKKQIMHILCILKIKHNLREYTSPISGRVGWRVGFSLKNNFFKPLKWVFSP